MKQNIGHLNDPSLVEQFAYFLNRQGIANEILESEQGFEIWISHEEHVPFARKALEQMQNEQQTVVYKMPIGKLTATIIGICVALYILQYLGLRDVIYSQLMMSEYRYGIQEINSGQWWRLLTPILLHDPNNLLHILFNMMWLYELGNVIEANESPKRLGLLVMCIGLVSNLAQYNVSGSAFFGMSGVVYGLLGYLWYLSQFAREKTGYRVNQSVMLFMMAWLVLCFTGWVGNIANTAHVAGLITGGLLGAVAAKIWPAPGKQG